MNKFWVVFKETYRKNVQSIGFAVMILSPILIIGIGAAIGYFASQSEDDPLPIAVITENAQIQAMVTEGDSPLLIDETIDSEERAQAALSEEEIEGFAIIQVEEGTVVADYTSTESPGSANAEILRAMLSTFQSQLKGQELGLSPQEIAELSQPVEFNESSVEVGEGSVESRDETDVSDDFIKRGAAYLASIGIFMFIMTYSSIIAEEVASEKGTRIMEVILSSVTSTTHFFGKLVGILMVCLTQIMIYIVLGMIAYTQLKDLSFVQELMGMVDLGSILDSLIGFTLFFFIAGIVMYVVLAAFFGSLVTKIEDVNKAVTPVVFLALGGFYGGMFAFASPENMAVEILSNIPLFTPFIMPFRIAANSVTTTGIWISVAITIVFTILLTWISLMLYRSNVLVYSDANLLKTIQRSWSILKSERKSMTNK